MEKKRFIMTIQDVFNYGNRLQNYAMQKLTGGRSVISHKYKFIMLFRAFRQFYWGIISLFSKKKKILYRRMKSFGKFNRNIHFYHKIIKNYNKNEMNSFGEMEAFFITGSDQVWNPYFCKDMYFYMLGFSKKRGNNIAIAPSIGVDKLTELQNIEFKKYINNFKVLSCREESGSNIISTLTDIECTTLIDPTLMLSDKEWDIICKKPKFHDENKKYILLYFLGDLSIDYKTIVALISKKYGLDVINILDESSEYYSCGPSEFIWLIKHCSIMLTDSFHGSVFSYIYEKPLRIFKRIDSGPSINSRLTNLVRVLHLSNEIYLSDDSNLDHILEVNYDKSYLLVEQQKFKAYLDEAFKE